MMTMDKFNDTFQHLAGGDDLKKFIGRRVKFAGTEPSDGTIHRDGVFEVVGTQLDWKKRPCLRVKCVSIRGEAFEDRFGHVMPLSRVEFC